MPEARNRRVPGVLIDKPVLAQERFHRADTFFGTLELKKVRGIWDRFVSDRGLLGDSAPDQRRRLLVLACGGAANQLARHRQIFHPRPYRRVTIALEDMRLKVA